MSKRNSPYNGLLIVDKPGRTCRLNDCPPHADAPNATEQDFPTSHDVVQRVRRWTRQRRIGHTGTLDPMASGVLVLCLGHATRLVEYYQHHPKQYYAEITLGSATDTYDAFGAETQRAPVPPLSTATIEAALAQFRGDIEQMPPLYSALKQGGESLHRKARRGEEVTLTPRPVTFYQIDLLHYMTGTGTTGTGTTGTGTTGTGTTGTGDAAGAAASAPECLALRVRCSAGGYIRSLAHDLGRALGTVAHLSGLRREAAGPFALADAHTLEAIEAAAGAGAVEELLLPLGARLEMPRLLLDDETAVRLGHGQRVVLHSGLQGPDAESVAGQTHDALAQGVDAQGNFLGVVRYLGSAQNLSSAQNLGPAQTPGDQSDAADEDAERTSQETQATIWKAEKWFIP